MMAELQRVQVLLERTQRRALAQIAKHEGRSVSAVLREMIQRGLAQRANERQQWKDALALLKKIRQANQAHGLYQGDLVAEARAERAEQLEALWHK
jgi:predicted kinase